MEDWSTVGEAEVGADDEIGRVTRRGIAPSGRITPGRAPAPAMTRAPLYAPVALQRFVPPTMVPTTTTAQPVAVVGVSEERARDIAREIAREVVREEAQRMAVPQSYRQPGAPEDPDQLFVLGFTTGSVLAPGGIVTIQAQPQRGFRGERLVVDVRREGTSAQTAAVSITGLRVGESSQFVGAGAVPAETFAPSAFGVRLALDPAGPGIVIAMDFSVQGLTAPDKVVVTAALIGKVRRQ